MNFHIEHQDGLWALVHDGVIVLAHDDQRLFQHGLNNMARVECVLADNLITAAEELLATAYRHRADQHRLLGLARGLTP